jgi:hypothetical protein
MRILAFSVGLMLRRKQQSALRCAASGRAAGPAPRAAIRRGFEMMDVSRQCASIPWGNYFSSASAARPASVMRDRRTLSFAGGSS